MRISEHIDALEREGRLLADTAAAAGLDAAVPPCPGWTVRDLVTHLGGVHRWAAGIVRDRLAEDPAPSEDELDKPGAQDAVEWFREGHAALVRTLRDADPGLRCYTFLPAPSPLAFWARRQAHETAIHRVDAEAAAGTAVTPATDDFARDGVEELLRGFAARSRRRSEVPRTLALRPAHGEGWLVTLSDQGLRTTTDNGSADCTISGDASDLYYWLWNRPATVEVTGEQSFADYWRTFRVRWS